MHLDRVHLHTRTLASSQPSHVVSPLSPNSCSRVFSFRTSSVVFDLSTIKPSNKPPIRALPTTMQALTSRSVRKHPRSLSHSTRSPQSLSPPTRSHPHSTDAKPSDLREAFNLIEGFDVPAIEEKVARYQEENAEQIMINRSWKAKELAASKAHPAQNDADGYACYNGSTVQRRDEDILRRMEDKLREKETNAQKVEVKQNLRRVENRNARILLCLYWIVLIIIVFAWFG